MSANNMKNVEELLESKQQEIDNLNSYDEAIQHLADKLNKLSIIAAQSGLTSITNNSGEVIAGGLAAKAIGTFQVKWYDENNSGYMDSDEWDSSERKLVITGSSIYYDSSLNIIAGDSLDQQMEYYYKTFCTGEYVYQLDVKMILCNSQGVELGSDKQIANFGRSSYNNTAKIISIVKYSNKNGGVYSVTAQFGRMFFIFNYNAAGGTGTGALSNSYYYNLDDYVRGSLTGRFQNPSRCICGVENCNHKGKAAKAHINGYGKPVSGRINYALYQLAGKSDCFSYGHNSSWTDFWWLVFSGLDKSSPINRRYEIENYQLKNNVSGNGTTNRNSTSLFGMIHIWGKKVREWLKNSIGFKGHGVKFVFKGFVAWIKGFRDQGGA